MNEPKLFASLTPSLLARKGGARPAMRPQLGPLHTFQSSVACQIDEDLGWNDMGDTEDEYTPETAPIQAEIVQLPGTVPSVAARPEVVRQRAEVTDRIAAPVPRQRRQRGPVLDGARRAAFTLRIDADRHLQLRLACTLAGRSAQQLVTDALDRLISELPDVSALAAKVRKGRN